MSDPQDRAEALDADKIRVTRDPEIETVYPFDEMMGADEYGTTAAEERVDEPLDERVERERPDPLVEELKGDDEFEAVDPTLNPEAYQPYEEPVGRLYENGTDEDVTDFIDEEGDSVGGVVPADDLSAEEAAIHPTDPPPMGRPGGGYVD